MPPASRPAVARLSVIVPVRDDAGRLAECLQAIVATAGPGSEIIVVDDGSTDESFLVAERAGVRALRLPRAGGAAQARNTGARHADGDVLCFVDADVVVHGDTLARLAGVLAGEPDVAAVFGSYDATPRDPGFVSQYRNLLHHFVHQHGATDASTFWAGCGAIRRRVFEAVGGFDAAVVGIEDIELGYRVRAAGHRIRLDPTIQATHLKRWTLRSVLWTDAMLRALPWARLVLARRPPLDHLNVGRAQRLSVAGTLVAVAAAGLTFFAPAAGLLSLLAALAVVVVNRRLLAFFARVRGPLFALGTVPLLFAHYLESGLCYAYASLTAPRAERRAASA